MGEAGAGGGVVSAKAGRSSPAAADGAENCQMAAVVNGQLGTPSTKYT
jgi:hypothetical protein